MRVLVVYGSTRGGTAGLAHMVADAFIRFHIHADVRRTSDVRSLSDYDAVIVGGALYSNRWHPDAAAFVGRRRSELRQLPVWFFSSGPLDDSARSGAVAPVPQVNALARAVEIRGHMTFGGLLDKRPSGLMGLFAWGQEGDFRDRHHVAEWVERIAEELGLDNESMVRVVDSAGQAVEPKPQRRPTVVIVPHRREPDEIPEFESQFTDDEMVDLTTDVRIQWPRQLPPKAPNSLARIRNYLTLDEEETIDEGLDLLVDVAEP